MEKDPIHRLEEIARDMHDSAGRVTQPVLKRYPLLFLFLLTFSIAAIIHGFELLTDQIEIFNRYPALLITLGIVALALTGTVYKTLGRHDL